MRLDAAFGSGDGPVMGESKPCQSLADKVAVRQLECRKESNLFFRTFGRKQAEMG